MQKGCTALMWAAKDAHIDCVRLLVEAGADKDAKNKVRLFIVALILYLEFTFIL